jgi:uncharacterized protein YuzE
MSYDKATDSLYVELRDEPSKRTIELAEDVMLDLNVDGAVIGYDIQHASTKKDFIASLVLGNVPTAAE